MFKKQLLLLLSFIFVNIQVMGNHIAGLEMFYKHISDSTYEFTVYVYVNCSSAPVTPNFPIEISSSCGATITLPMTYINSTDITFIPGSCIDKSFCNSGTVNGVRRVMLQGTTTLPTVCCNFSIKSGEYGTSVAATNYNNSGPNGYLSIILNLNRCEEESSPLFNRDPTFFIRHNQVQHLSFDARDTAKNEFITYEMDDPLGDNYQKILYFPSFSKSIPFSVLKPYAPKSEYPSGFFFDTLTGEMMFKPVRANEVTIYTVKAKKWKKVNGKLILVSEAAREIVSRLISINNTLPSFENFENEFVLCPDTGLYWFEFPISDADNSDSLIAYYTHTLGNKLQIIETGTKNDKIVKIGYHVDTQAVNNFMTELLKVEVSDSSCPYNGLSVKTFKLKIKPYLPDSFSFTKKLNCRVLNLDLVNNSSISSPKVVWEAKSLTDSITKESKIAFLELKDTGWYKIQMTVSGDGHCTKQVYYDSVYLPQIAFLNAEYAKDTSICFDSRITFEPKINNGTTPLKYSWSTGDTTPKITVNVASQQNTYWFVVSDANGCSTPQNNISVHYYNPTVSISGDKELCLGNNINLFATLTDTIAPMFGWQGFNTSEQLVDAPIQNKQYRFNLTDASGCKIDTVWQVKVYNPKIQFTHNADVCRGDSLIFFAQADSGKAPYIYNWINLSQIGQNAKIATQGLGLGFINTTLKVTDDLGCTITQGTKAFVKPKPVIKFVTIPVTCKGNDLIDLTPYSAPQGGIWMGKGVDTLNNKLNPLQSDTGTIFLMYSYTNNDNCTDSGSTTIKIEPQNIANFSASKTVGEEGDTVIFTNTSIAKDISNSKWNFGDPSSNFNTQTGKDATHIYNDSGIYTIQLIVTGGVCPEDTLIKSNFITINKKLNVGISVRESAKSNLLIYPNPAKDRLTIEADNLLAEIVLVDVLGRRYTIESNINATKTEIEIQHLSAGIYVIEAKDIEGNMYTSKVQISR